MPEVVYYLPPDSQNASHGEYEYTCEQPATWSPYNCNLQMGAIKVITEHSTPDKVAEKLGGCVEDTILLINMMKDLRVRELKKAKVND